MPGFLITLLLGTGVFVLHALAGAPSLRALAFSDAIASLAMLGVLAHAAARREAILLAMTWGPLAGFAMAMVYLLAAQSHADWAGLGAILAGALGPCLALISANALARVSDRHALIRAVYLAGAASALWSSLSALAVSRGAAPSAWALTLDFAANPAAGFIFALSFAAAAFALGEEAVRAPRRAGPRLAPLAQRLLLPGAACGSCLSALLLSGAPLPLLAAGLGAGGAALGLGLRARRPAGPLWALMPALLALALFGQKLAAGGVPPWAGPWRSPLTDPAWPALLAVAIGMCLIAKDRKRAPSRGLALVLGQALIFFIFATFSAAAQSPSGLMACAALIGIALSYQDGDAKPARRQKLPASSGPAKAR